MSPAPARATLTFERERTTASTVVFKEQVEQGQPPVVGTLYVKKAALAVIGNPTILIVTIEGAN